jgi:hypothetical protein
MKKIFLIAFVFIYGCSAYEYITSEQGYKEYIEQHNLTKDKAFDICIEWIAVNFRSANTVVQLKDKESGKIVVQAVGSYYYDILKAVLINYNYTMNITIKDQKIKFEFTTHGTDNAPHPQVGDLPKILSDYEQIKNDILAALKNLKKDDF